MKIAPVTETRVDRESRTPKATQEGGGDFSALVDEELQKVGNVGGQMSEIAELKLFHEAYCLPATPLSPGRTTETTGTETTGFEPSIEDAIGSLKHLETMLNKPMLNSLSAGKSIEAIEEAAEKLQQGVQSLPAGHPVRQIADELKVLAHVESVKWNRGDYD
jgi:hypothetical protein